MWFVRTHRRRGNRNFEARHFGLDWRGSQDERICTSCCVTVFLGLKSSGRRIRVSSHGSRARKSPAVAGPRKCPCPNGRARLPSKFRLTFPQRDVNANHADRKLLSPILVGRPRRRTEESNLSGCKQPSNAWQACPVPTPGVFSEAAPVIPSTLPLPLALGCDA
jgi:hypothetical protein